MIWKKKKDASAEAAETAEAKSGVSAFAKKNWKWLVPVVVVAACLLYTSDAADEG